MSLGAILWCLRFASVSAAQSVVGLLRSVHPSPSCTSEDTFVRWSVLLQNDITFRSSCALSAELLQPHIAKCCSGHMSWRPNEDNRNAVPSPTESQIGIPSCCCLPGHRDDCVCVEQTVHLTSTISSHSCHTAASELPCWPWLPCKGVCHLVAKWIHSLRSKARCSLICHMDPRGVEGLRFKGITGHVYRCRATLLCDEGHSFQPSVKNFAEGAAGSLRRTRFSFRQKSSLPKDDEEQQTSSCGLCLEFSKFGI